jgi:hypothetical protein
MSHNPFHALISFGLCAQTEENQRLASLRGKRSEGPGEWGPRLRVREAELQVLVDAALRAADETGYNVE